jgi:hypothetical protein
MALFDEILGGGEGTLERLVRDRQQEGVDLDFKAKEDPERGAASKDDLRNLGKLLSAFSNSAGGLLIWGVDARKSPGDEVDCATKLVPIADYTRFQSDLTRAAGQLLMPRHDGIRIEAIPSKNPGYGHVIVQVDRSERRPHMSMATNDRRYWKRAGESTFAMEHYDVEDSFKRLVVPTLEVSAALGFVGRWGDHHRLKITLSLHNSSSVTARFPYLFIDDSSGAKLDLYGLDGNHRTGLPQRVGDGVRPSFEGGADEVVHPGVSRPVTNMVVEIRQHQLIRRISVGGRGALELANADPVIISYRCGCEHARMTTGEIRYELADLARVFNHAE